MLLYTESRGRQILYAITYMWNLEEDKYYMISLNIWNLKISTNELIYRRKTDSQTRKTNMVTKVAGRYKLGV